MLWNTLVLYYCRANLHIPVCSQKVLAMTLQPVVRKIMDKLTQV